MSDSPTLRDLEDMISEIDNGVRLQRARIERLKQNAELRIERQQERKRWLSRTKAALKQKRLLPK